MPQIPLKDVRFAKARDVMTKNVVYIDGSASVAEAVTTMRETSVSSLLVNRRNSDDAWGIITQKDVVNKVVDPGKDVIHVKVYEIMSKPLITVAPGLALKYCARLFRMSGIRRAPVFDGKEIVGILSHTDIFNAIQDESHLLAGVSDETDPDDELLAELDPAALKDETRPLELFLDDEEPELI